MVKNKIIFSILCSEPINFVKIAWRVSSQYLLGFFFSAIRSNWSPSSKRAVSEGAPKPNLAKIQVKLVLLKNKLTFWSHKVDLGNWEYLQNKSAWNNFFSKLICHENFPKFLSSACFIPNLIIFLLKQKNQWNLASFGLCKPVKMPV